MTVEKKRKAIINLVYYALILGFVYLILKKAFWLLFPIFISFFIALCLQPPVNAISRKTPIKRGPASVFCVLLLIAIIAGLMALLGVSVFNYLKGFMEYIKDVFGNAEQIIERVRTWLISLSDKLPQSFSKMLVKNINDIFAKFDPVASAEAAAAAAEAAEAAGEAGAAAVEAAQSSGGLGINLSTITSWLTTPISSVVSTALQIPSILLNILITIIMTCFLTADFNKVSSFLSAQLSEKRQKDFVRAKHLLKTSFLNVLKAYGLIIIITFSEMLIGLILLKLIGVFHSKYIVLIAAVTAIVDIFPVLGTGTVIFPWAAYCVITKNYSLAVGLIVLYLVITVIRQIIEPKLVAGQLGLPPFVTIIGMFLGLKLFGFIGMIAMPILIIMLKLLNDEGILHLWKNAEPVKVTDGGAETESSQENATADETPGTSETAE